MDDSRFFYHVWRIRAGFSLSNDLPTNSKRLIMNPMEMSFFLIEFDWKYLISGLFSLTLGLAGIAALVHAARSVLKHVR